MWNRTCRTFGKNTRELLIAGQTFAGRSDCWSIHSSCWEWTLCQSQSYNDKHCLHTWKKWVIQSNSEGKHFVHHQKTKNIFCFHGFLLEDNWFFQVSIGAGCFEAEAFTLEYKGFFDCSKNWYVMGSGIGSILLVVIIVACCRRKRNKQQMSKTKEDTTTDTAEAKVPIEYPMPTPMRSVYPGYIQQVLSTQMLFSLYKLGHIWKKQSSLWMLEMFRLLRRPDSHIISAVTLFFVT